VRQGKARADAPISDSDARLRDSLLAALVEHKGNVTHVARAMGCTRMQVHRWMRRFQIDPAALRR
jgi:transcriptional regulator of acetoin/glycerol metabolism